MFLSWTLPTLLFFLTVCIGLYYCVCRSIQRKLRGCVVDSLCFYLRHRERIWAIGDSDRWVDFSYELTISSSYSISYSASSYVVRLTISTDIRIRRLTVGISNKQTLQQNSKHLLIDQNQQPASTSLPVLIISILIVFPQPNPRQHLPRILAFLLQLPPPFLLCFHIPKRQAFLLPIRNTQLLSLSNIPQSAIHDDFGVEVAFPADVLVKGGVVEHASQAEDDGLCRLRGWLGLGCCSLGWRWGGAGPVVGVVV